MKCIKCGFENPTGNNYCWDCGARLEEIPKSSKNQSDKTKSPEEYRKEYVKYKRVYDNFVAYFGLIFLLSIIIILFFPKFFLMLLSINVYNLDIGWGYRILFCFVSLFILFGLLKLIEKMFIPDYLLKDFEKEEQKKL